MSLATRWGGLVRGRCSGFKHDEQHRPEFQGTAMPSIVTGRTTLFFDEAKKRRAIILSIVGIATMVVRAWHGQPPTNHTHMHAWQHSRAAWLWPRPVLTD